MHLHEGIVLYFNMQGLLDIDMLPCVDGVVGVFSACGGIRNDSRMPVLTAHFPIVLAKGGCSLHH